MSARLPRLAHKEGERYSIHTEHIRPLCRNIIVIILGISFMQGIYTYISETNHVPREHCVATILM